jgi:glucose-1-phosphate thymidylyltransferase
MSSSITKGIILAGGAGTRLFPLTQISSKQLMPVYDKPMIYYPLATLMLAGVKDFLIITTPHDQPQFVKLLGDGSSFGISIEYATQPEPKGIAQAFVIGADFIGDDSVALVLGDNLFYGKIELKKVFNEFKGGAKVFGYPVKDPERYGVVEFSRDGKAVGLEEKPAKPKSNYAVPGLYLYDNRVVKMAKELKPSARGELEITDLNIEYLNMGELRVEKLGRGIAWLDTGTHESLLEAGHFIYTIEARQGTKIACLEEIALQMGFVGAEEMEAIIAALPKSVYREYVENAYAEYKDALEEA